MTHHDSGWRPTPAMETYDGFDVWDHNVGPHEINDGEVDGDIQFEELEEK